MESSLDDINKNLNTESYEESSIDIMYKTIILFMDMLRKGCRT